MKTPQPFILVLETCVQWLGFGAFVGCNPKGKIPDPEQVAALAHISPPPPRCVSVESLVRLANLHGWGIEIWHEGTLVPNETILKGNYEW